MQGDTIEEEAVQTSAYGPTPGPIANICVRVIAALQLGFAMIAAAWVWGVLEGELRIAAAVAIGIQGIVTATLFMAFAAIGDNLVGIRHALEDLGREYSGRPIAKLEGAVGERADNREPDPPKQSKQSTVIMDLPPDRRPGGRNAISTD